MLKYFDYEVNTSQAILTPMTFYGTYDWSASHNRDYWNKGLTIYNINNQNVLKTIYDPCPTLYSIPAVAAFSGFTSTGESSTNMSQFNVNGTWNKGWNFYTHPDIKTNTIFMAAIGYRPRNNGYLIYNVGIYASRYTSGSATQDNHCYYFQSNESSVEPVFDWYKAFALPIAMNKI